MKRSEWADIWIQRSAHDLDVAEALFNGSFWDTCALMCQQAAEKAVKGLYVDVNDAEPPKTHRLERMAAELGAPIKVVDAASVLVGDYSASRYPPPGVGFPFQAYTKEDATDRLEKARQVISWVENHWEDSDGNEASS